MAIHPATYRGGGLLVTLVKKIPLLFRQGESLFWAQQELIVFIHILNRLHHGIKNDITQGISIGTQE